jgi:hypothetical protein
MMKPATVAAALALALLASAALPKAAKLTF